MPRRAPINRRSRAVHPWSTPSPSRTTAGGSRLRPTTAPCGSGMRRRAPMYRQSNLAHLLLSYHLVVMGQECIKVRMRRHSIDEIIQSTIGDMSKNEDTKEIE